MTNVIDFLSAKCFSDNGDVDQQAFFSGVGSFGDEIEQALRVREHVDWNSET